MTLTNAVREDIKQMVEVLAEQTPVFAAASQSLVVVGYKYFFKAFLYTGKKWKLIRKILCIRAIQFTKGK